MSISVHSLWTRVFTTTEHTNHSVPLTQRRPVNMLQTVAWYFAATQTHLFLKKQHFSILQPRHLFPGQLPRLPLMFTLYTFCNNSLSHSDRFLQKLQQKLQKKSEAVSTVQYRHFSIAWRDCPIVLLYSSCLAFLVILQLQGLIAKWIKMVPTWTIPTFCFHFPRSDRSKCLLLLHALMYRKYFWPTRIKNLANFLGSHSCSKTNRAVKRAFNQVSAEYIRRQSAQKAALAKYSSFICT